MYGVAASNSAAQVSTRFMLGTTPSAARLARTSRAADPAGHKAQDDRAEVKCADL